MDNIKNKSKSNSNSDTDINAKVTLHINIVADAPEPHATCTASTSIMAPNKQQQNDQHVYRMVRVTPRRTGRDCDRHTISDDIKRLEASWSKLFGMYRALQASYNSLRTSLTTMSITMRRLNDDQERNAQEIKTLKAAKHDQETKIKELEQKIIDLESQNSIQKETINELETGKDQGDTKLEAQISVLKSLKNAIEAMRLDLGGWGRFNLTDSDVDSLFETVDKLI